MAATNFTPISLYYSTTASAVPSAGNLVAGELALNTVDEKLYFKNSAGTVKLLASNATSAPVLSFSAGTTGFTPSTATTGAVTLAGTLNVANGGTGSTSLTAGRVLFGAGTSAVGNSANLFWDNGNSRLGIGTATPRGPIDAIGRSYFQASGSNNVLTLLNTSGGDGSIQVTGTSTTLNYAFNTYSTSNAIYIQNDGNVGFGTASPASAQKVTIEGTNQLRLRSSTTRYRSDLTTTSNGLLINSYDDTGAVYIPISIDGSSLSFRISSNEKGSFDGTGNLIVGNASGTRVTTAQGGGVQAISETYNVDAHSRWYIGRDAGATGGSGIVFNGGVSAANVAGVQMWSPANQIMAWAYGNGSGWTETMRVSNNGGFSVGTTANPGPGAIYATGNITAYYSDERLKDVKGRITDALAKVRRLSGVYYTNNETAKALGYTSDEMQVGVLANQMKGELPEIVKPAPFDLDENGNSKSGENYMTVQYERGLPLLIEALKELADKFDAYVETH